MLSIVNNTISPTPSILQLQLVTAPAPRKLEARPGFGGYEDGLPVGPQFQISWKADKEAQLAYPSVGKASRWLDGWICRTDFLSFFWMFDGDIGDVLFSSLGLPDGVVSYVTVFKVGMSYGKQCKYGCGGV